MVQCLTETLDFAFWEEQRLSATFTAPGSYNASRDLIFTMDPAATITSLVALKNPDPTVGAEGAPSLRAKLVVLLLDVRPGF
jgi:hypothetical protein